jgi:hypothetical protein
VTKIREDKMGKTCFTHGSDESALKMLFGTSERNITTYHVGDIRVSGRIILKWIIMK